MSWKGWIVPAPTTAVLVLAAICLVAAPVPSAAKLYWGIGTGFTFLNAEGDQGVTVNIGQQALPVQAEVDLDPDDFSDMMESAFGLGGYVTDGTWMVTYSVGQLKLGGEPAGSIGSTGISYEAEWSFDITGAEATFGYPVYRHPEGRLTVRPFAGVRYLKHELGADLTLTGATVNTASRGVDHNWTDVLIGSAFDVKLAPKWSWSTHVDAGFGGSEGTYSFGTGVSWRALQWLSFGPTFNYSAIEYENGEKGDSDWYLYDANEFGAGVSLLAHF